MTGYIWVIWSERNERLFNHKANNVLSLLDSILFFLVVDLRVGNLAIPLKKKVDLALLTHAHKRLKTGDVSSTRARVDSDTSLMLVVMPDGGVDGNGGAGFDAGG